MTRYLITGANRGIGLALVAQLLKRPDATVLATCRDPLQADDLQALNAQYGERLTVLPLEQADAQSIRSLAGRAAEHVEALDVLINNAAINVDDHVQSLTGITQETMLEVLNVNTVGPLLVAQALVGLLRKGQNPKLINISTQMASIEQRTYGGSYAYTASKAALNMTTRGLAADLRGVTVIALDPGWVKTRMGGRGAQLTTEESALGVLRVIDGLTPADSGGYFRWNGKRLPW